MLLLMVTPFVHNDEKWLKKCLKNLSGVNSARFLRYVWPF